MAPVPTGQPSHRQPGLEDALSTYGTATANGPSTTSGGTEGSTAQQAKDKAQETAQQAAGQAKGRVRDQVDQRSTDAGQRVSTMAEDVRSVGDELRKQGKDQPAKLADQAAQRAESLGGYLQRSDGDTILRDLEDFGRRQPWAVIAGGVALGFPPPRFPKAAPPPRHEQPAGNPTDYSSQQRWSGPNGGDLTTGAPTTRTGMASGDVTGGL